MRKFAVVGVLVVLGMIQLSSAQQIDSLLGIYGKKMPREKIHIHFDNSLYTQGQTVWYKAYVVSDLEPSELSKNLYIDWFDEAGKLLKRTIAPLINATASGDFTVPQKYTGSRLQVMAYTKWMLNFDSAFLFHQTLAIAQPSASFDSRSAITPVTTLQFFPEGGDMIENVPCNIAFKAINSAGMAVGVSGTIVNKNKQVVAQFSPEHNGMGKFLLTPLAGETYTAEWNDPQGNRRSTPLPAAKISGLVLTIKEGSASRVFTIERPTIAEERFKKLTIIGTMDQQVVFKGKTSLADKNKISGKLPTTQFSSGVLQLTIFDSDMQPVAERVLFVNNEEYRFTADIQTDTFNLGKRGKNVYQIELSDTVHASLSLSVTEGEGVYDSSRNIISQLLLSSEIKGHVQDAAYYFSSPEDSVARHLDLVMLTNGWRRFVWNDVLTGKTPQLKYTYDSGYLSLAGKVDHLTDAKIKKAELMNLIIEGKDSVKHFMFTPLHPDGSFREDNMILYDTCKIYYALNRTFLPLRSHVVINNTFLPFDSTARNRSLAKYLPDTTGMAHIKVLVAEQRKLDSLMRKTTLQEVIVRTKVKTRLQEMDENYTSGLFGNGNARSFNVADDPAAASSQSVFSYLNGRVAGLQINNAYSFRPSVLSRGSRVALFLDEMHTDAERLSTTPMSDVAYIKVFSPPFIGASGGGAGGAIAVYTRKGNDTKGSFLGLEFTLLPGYTPVKEFYSPNYAEKQMNFSQPDFRRTLFWKPNIVADGVHKKIKISFYNNDISHTLQLVMEGMSSDGRLIHVSKLLK